MKSEVIRVYTKLTVRVVPSCFLLHVVPEREPFLTPFPSETVDKPGFNLRYNC